MRRAGNPATGAFPALSCRYAPAEPRDAEAISEIYNQGIADRIATLETKLRTPEERRSWLGARGLRHPVVVCEGKHGVRGWASLNSFNPREAYDNVADFSIYVDRGSRGRGVGSALLAHLERPRGVSRVPQARARDAVLERRGHCAVPAAGLSRGGHLPRARPGSTGAGWTSSSWRRSLPESQRRARGPGASPPAALRTFRHGPAPRDMLCCRLVRSRGMHGAKPRAAFEPTSRAPPLPFRVPAPRPVHRARHSR